MTEVTHDVTGLIVRRRRGILTGSIGPFNNILKLPPPMVFSRENADYFLEIVDGVLAEL